MAKLLNWRNVDAPKVDAGFMNTAVNATSQAGTGFARFVEQMKAGIARDQEMATNQAANQFLATGQMPGADSNIDPTSILTNALTKAQTTGADIGNQQAQFDLDNAPELFDQNTRKSNADIEQSLAAAGASKASSKRTSQLAKIEDWEHMNNKEKVAYEKQWNTEAEAINEYQRQMKDTVFNNMLTEFGLGIDPFTGQGREPTQAEINELRQAADAFVQSNEGAQIIDSWARSNGFSTQGIDRSKYGQSVIAAQQRAAEVEADQLKTLSAYDLLQRNSADDRAAGRFGTTGLSTNGYIGLTPEEIKRQKVDSKTLRPTLTSSVNSPNLRNIDVSDSKQGKANRQVLLEMADYFPNSSMFLPVVEGYVDSSGNIDVNAMRDAFKDGSVDTVIDEANKRRVAQGLPEVGEGIESTSGNKKDAEGAAKKSSSPSKSFDALVDSFKNIGTSTSAAPDAKEISAVVTDAKTAQELFDNLPSEVKWDNKILTGKIMRSLALVEGARPLGFDPALKIHGFPSFGFEKPLSAQDRAKELDKLRGYFTEMSKRASKIKDIQNKQSKRAAEVSEFDSAFSR